MNRVYFFSKTDLSIGYHLELAEQRIREIECGDMPNDLTGVIELWHINKLFSEDCRLNRWTEDEFQSLKRTANKFNSIVGRFFANLDSIVISQEYEQLEWGYRKTFWRIISDYHCLDRISAVFLRTILLDNINDLRSILLNKSVVEKFKVVLREILLENKLGALILLDRYAIRHHGEEEKVFLPSNLSIIDKENVIDTYLEGDEPNLNYVRLIEQVKDTDDFVLSPKIRLKAERLSRKLNENLKRDPRTAITHFQMEIEFSDDENVDIFSYSNDNGNLHYIYSRKYIIACNNEDRIAYCARVFLWFDNHLLLNLINKNCEVDSIEWALIDNGRDAYPAFQVFQRKNDLALYQLSGFYRVLTQSGSSLESELKIFYEQNLRKEFGYPAGTIKLPKSDDDWLSKCRIIFPEIDNLARQYDTYVMEDEIDPELLVLLKPMKMTEARSLLANKYLEINEGNEDVKMLLYCLFNSGSLLDYVDPYKDKHYHSFVDLMNHESVPYSNYESHQKPSIDYLIEKEIIKVNAEGIIEYANTSAIEILNYIWEFGACSYWHLDDIGRAEADRMIDNGWLLTDDHLLCKAERKYFSFYTDNAEFTNGYAYRNHYAHGNTPPVEDVNAHATAYFVLLRLLVVLIVKIYDDLWVARRAFAIGIRSSAKVI